MTVVVAGKCIARVSLSSRATPRTGRRADFIKVQSLVPREANFAIAAEANKVGLLPGASLHLELWRFVAAGFMSMEGLQTATLNPARFYNWL